MGGYLHLLHLNRDTAESVTLGRFKGGGEDKWQKGETDPNPRGLYGRRNLNNVTRLCCDWREGTRLMRFKRRRLFNSAHLFKDILGENRDFFIFPLLLFYPHFPATWCFHFLYFKCCQRGMCFLVFGFLSFFLVVYIYILRWGLKKICGILWKTNHEHSLGVFVKLPCMYSMHVNVVVQAWLQYIWPLRTQLLPLKLMASWRNLLIVSNVEIITNI